MQQTSPEFQEFRDAMMEYLEKKGQVRSAAYVNRTLRKFLRLVGISQEELNKLASPTEMLDVCWFDQHFINCPFRLAFLRTTKSMPIQDFFWRPTKTEIWQAFDEARDNYAGLAETYDPTFHRVALIYNDLENKKDVVLREHHDSLSLLPGSYPRCLRDIRNTTYIMEPLEGFCETLKSSWNSS